MLEDQPFQWHVAQSFLTIQMNFQFTIQYPTKYGDDGADLLSPSGHRINDNRYFENRLVRIIGRNFYGAEQRMFRVRVQKTIIDQWILVDLPMGVGDVIQFETCLRIRFIGA